MQLTMAMKDDSSSAAQPISLESCYAMHYAKVFRLGLRYGAGNAAWAEDLTHDVFIALAENASDLDFAEDVGGWLYRVASNLAISKLRNERSFLGRVRTMLSVDQRESIPGADVSFEHNEVAVRAMNAMRQLPAKQQVILSMLLIDGLPQNRIAQLLSMSEGYVSKLVARGLAKIRSEGWEVSS
ncbi:MAG: RNA polymerase sigma factor [Kofleriaceae bacterium]